MNFIQKHKKAIKYLLFAYIVFVGCFTFPIKSEGEFYIDLMKLYVLIASYGIIGTSLAGIYGAKKGKTVFIITLMFTMVGLLCRYLLEFGEVSNTYNFTLLNIVSYIVIIPVAVLITYLVSLKTTEHKED